MEATLDQKVKNEIYIDPDGKKYNVGPKSKAQFLLDHPDAVLYEGPVKTNPNAQGVAAGEEQAPNMASNSGNGTLVFTPPKYEEQFQTYLSTKEKNSEFRLRILTKTGMDPSAPQLDEESAVNYADKFVNTLDFSVFKETQDIRESLNSSLLSMIKGDRYLQNHLLKDIQKILEPKIENFKNKLKENIDLTDLDQVEAANNKLTNYATKLYLDTVSNNRTYNKRIDVLKDAVIKSYNNKFNRLSEMQRQQWVDAKRSELGLTDDSKLWEGIQKGFKQVNASLRRTDISIDANELKRLNTAIEGKNDNEIAYGPSFNVGTQTYDTRPGSSVTVKQAKIKIIKVKEKILNKYLNLKEIEQDLKAFQTAKLDGLMPESWGDLALLVGEQAIQLPIAILTFGTGIFAQEYGNAYFDTIIAKMEANGEEFSEEGFLNYLEAGEGDGGIAAVSATIQSALEFTGATTIVGTLITKPGKAFVRSIVKDGIRRFVKQGGLKGSSKAVARGYMVEYLTESFQTLTSQISKGFSIADSGKYIDLDEIKQSGAQGGIVGAFLPFSFRGAAYTIKETTALANRVASFGDVNSQSYILKDLKKNIKASVIKGEITKEQGEKQLSAISDVDNANMKIHPSVVGGAKQKLINLLIEESKIINENKSVDKTFAERNEARLEEIRQEKLKIYVTAELTDQVLKGRRFAGALNQKLKIIEVKNSKDFVKTAKKFGIKDAQETDSGRVSDPKSDGSAVMVMNMEVAGQTGDVTVAGHEILHNGLYKTLYNGKTTAVVELSTLLKDHLMKIDPDLFKEGSILNKILTQYQNDPNYTEQARAEELFNAISDIYNNPLIKKPNEGFLAKLGDILRRILQDIGWKKIRFEDGADVFNFIKDYSHAVRKGKTSGAVIKAMQEGIEISDEILNESRSIEKIISKASKRKVDSQKVTDIYNEKGAEGAMEIIELFDPILNKITNNYKNTPNFDFNELKDAIAFDERGLLGLIMDYTKAKAQGAPLAGYINKYLGKRAIEQAQKLLGKEFMLDVDTLKGTPDTTTESTFELEEKTVEVKKDDLASKLGVDPELSDKVLEAVELAFGTKLPNISVKAFNAALTKTFRTKLKPEIVKFINDTGGYENFLTENFEAIYDNLPLSTINKRFQAFKEPLLDKDGVQMREKLPVEKGRDVKTLGQGKPLFKKRKISEKEWVEYFTDKTAYKKSALGNRKIALTEEIGVELAFDATNEILKNESIMNRFREIQELSGIGVSESYIQEIARKIDRGYRSKAMKGLTPSMINSTATDLAKILKKFEGNTNAAEYINYKFVGWTESQAKFIKDFVEDLWEKKYIKGSTFGGIIFEQNVISELEKFGLPVLKSGGANYDNSSPDIQIASPVFENGILYIEAKQNAEAKMGGGSFSIDFTNEASPKLKFIAGKKEISKSELPNGELLNSALERMMPDIKKALDFINEKEGTNHKQFPPSPAIIKKETAELLKQQDFYKKAFGRGVEVTPASIEKHYNDKNNFYIHIGGKGTYFLGKNPLNIENIDRFNFGLTVNFSVGLAGLPSNIKEGTVAWEMKQNNQRRWGFRGEMKITNPKSVTKSRFNIENESDAGVLNENLSSKASKGLSRQFNELIQGTTGTPWYQKFSPVKAKLVGQSKGRNKFFVPYSAEDFLGLLYVTLGKGKVGDQQRQWYEDNLIRPFSKGIQAWQREKENSLREWSLLKKEASKDVPIGLTKVNESGFTNQDSIRIYMWTKQGMEIEGILKKEINENLKIVRKDPLLKAFAERLMVLNPEGYPPPTENWNSGDITTDLVGYVNDVRRAEFLEEWRENIDTVFSDQNKDKLRALYGNGYVVALEDIITRMKTGRNRRSSASQNEKIFLDWTNDSVGTIMFFNTRSALLQTISAVNFINWSDNNPLKAGMALANFPQFVKDFTFLFNSDFLKQRRSGLQIDVNADEIANSAKTSKNKVRAMLSAILQFGFTPTQIADSFAIASGGASFYRNRMDTYVKQGMSQKEAQEKAFTDFMEIAEETQQSARPDRISMQQAGSLGRLILAFANTPMQYTRLTKKAFLDLINKRGDWKTNISKIVYYSVIQNIIFNSLQSALFALMFDDTTEDDEKRRYSKLLNGSIDSFVRGTGVYGAVATVIKNMVLEGIRQSKAKRSDYTRVALKSVSLSPPIDSKLRKLLAASRTFTYKQSKEKVYTEGFSLENPGFLAFGQIVSAGTNLPLDRVILKMDHLNTAMKPETELWQSIALALGYSEWDLNMIEPKAAPDIDKLLRKVDRIIKKY